MINEAQVLTAYSARLDELRALLSLLDTRSRRLSALRGFTFLAALAFAGLRIAQLGPPALWGAAGASIGAFIVFVALHGRVITRMTRIEARIRLVDRGPKRMACQFAACPDHGDRFLDPRHRYAGNLDIFGSGSLYQLLTAAETGAGEATLAQFLLAPTDEAEIALRQEAVRELAELVQFREDLGVHGAESGTKGRAVDPFVGWAGRRDDEPKPMAMRAGQALVVLTLVLLLLGEIAPSGSLGYLGYLWAVPLLAQALLLARLRPELEAVLKPVLSPEAPFGRYVAIFRLIEGQAFRSPRLVRLREQLAAPSASQDIGRLQTILSFAEARHNSSVFPVLNIVFLWDVWCAAAVIRWRARSGGRVASWLQALGEMEALASLGTFAYEHPSFVFPVVSSGPVHFVADGLGHPLLAPGRRVVNDVTIGGPGSALLVTGSNMSGKSTLLRAIGINTVIAHAGGPVCAGRFEVSVCDVYTSMHIRDSLEEGVSRFYAELTRLKEIVDAVNAGQRVLFLLDEVLHGTNSRERRIGATAVVLHLLDRGAVGAVSSHDLGLADLEAQSGGRVRNVHFQEQVDDGKMTFDYRLQPGVVTSANALRLMKLIGIEVDLPEA